MAYHLPPFTLLRRRFPDDRIGDVAAHTRAELEDCGVHITPGSRIAIAVGSRGITDIVPVTRAVVHWVLEKGAMPFLLPAMGSHGGATAEGQRALLEEYGLTEAAVGAPIVSSMEVVRLPGADGGRTRVSDLPVAEVPVYFSRDAAEADGTILINRVKPHTDFHGPYESGLVKMSVIGLGKHAAALALHALGVHGLREVIPQVARRVLAGGNVLLGVGLVENAYDATCILKAIPAARIFDEEPALLAEAYRRLPRLPVDDLDVLLLDEMGKDISGAGMDTTVIGRMLIRGEPEPEKLRIQSIAVGDLTAASHGNATGMGLADIITRRLAEKIDYAATYENIYTSTFLQRAKTPMIAEDDAQALDYALRGAGLPAPEKLRALRVRNTRDLQEMLASPAVAEELRKRNDITVVGEADVLRFRFAKETGTG